ncbi:MAG: glycosyltransferase family 4 protein [Actinobacteria bacterium]|nr:glycosyltransferase family 4 protein [Actinomycetota bacterium]
MMVIIITNVYLPLIGGVEFVVYHLSRILKNKNCEVSIITSRPKPNLPSVETVDGIKIYRTYLGLPGNSLKSSAYFALSFFPSFVRLIKIIRTEKPDIINLHFSDSAALYILLLKKIFNLPIVVSVHGNDIQKFPKESYIYRWLTVNLLRRADFVTACSKSLLEDAIKLEPSIRDKSIPTGNGIDLSEFDLKDIYKTERPYIFSFGRLEHKKGFDVLINSFKIISKKFPDFDLIIAGDGAKKDELQNLINNLDLKKQVKLMGMLPRREILNLLNGCEVFVCPSRIEPFGIVNLEAMAAGKPVIASKVDGVPEVIEDGVNGILVEPENVNQLAESIINLLKNGDLRNRLSVNGRKIVEEKYSWEVVGERYFDLFKSIVNRNVSPFNKGG